MLKKYKPKHKKEKHKHDWLYRPQTFSGWGIAECKTCGATETY